MIQENRTGKANYYEELNIMKGIAAILVVLGHAIMQTGIENMGFSVLYSVLYSFHMPLFFFASGFLSTKIFSFSSWKERNSYVKNRFLRLMLPYFAMGVLYLPARWLMGKFANEPYDFSSVWRMLIGENPDWALWFLYALFAVSVIAVCVVRKKNLPWMLGIAVILAFLSKIIILPTIICEEILFHLFFFLSGLFVRLHYEDWKKYIFTPQTIVLSLLAFSGGNYLLWYATQTAHTGAGCLKLITAPTGIILSLNLANMIVKAYKETSMPRKLGNLFGDYSMDIYMFAEPFKVVIKIIFWSLLNWNYMLCTVLCFVGSILCALLTSKLVIRRIPILKRLFLGI